MATENAWDIVKDMLRMGSALYRNGDRIAGAYGLNQQQFIVLSEIVNSGPINQKQLVGEMIIEKSSLSKIVKKLKSLDLVTSTSSPDDGRAIVVNSQPPIQYIRIDRFLGSVICDLHCSHT